MTQPVDSSILHEIVRLVEARKKVPNRVRVRNREYQITYLEDHQRRLEEALQRYDADRLNMLYGQLASKIKYQLLQRVPDRAAKPAARGRRAATKKRAAPAKRKSAAKRGAAKKGAGMRKKVAKTAKRKSATGARKSVAKRAPGRKRTGAKKR